MKRKFGVRGVLLLLALAPATLISSGLVAYFALTRIQDMDKSLIERGGAVVANLALASEFGVYSGNSALLDRLALSMLKYNSLARIAILDRESGVLVDRHPDSETGAASDLLWFEAPVLHTRIAVDTLMQGIGDTPPPAATAGTRIGVVRVAVSRAPTQQRQREVIRMGIAVLLLCLSAVTGIGLLFGGRIYRPIRRLSAAFDALSADRLDARVPERSPWELGRLERGFNLAAAAVQRSHQQLAEQVQSATVELRETLLALERNNAELARAHQEALEANAAKSRFLSSMSHEIRTPLQGVIAGADLLIKSRPLDHQQRVHAITIHHSAYLLLNLVNNLLDLSKIEATDALVFSQVDFDLYVLLRQIVRIMAPDARAKGIALRLETDPTLPKKLRGDSTRLGQIAVNLIGNAIKFTERGTVTVVVRRRETGPETTEAGGGPLDVRFDVRDTGIGIAEADRARIFEGYVQTHGASTRSYGGTGLGLTIAKQLVERMGGRIGVESTLGLGSRFWFELSFQPAAQPNGSDDPVSARTAARQGLHRALRVLVAEDNRTSRTVLQSILHDAGHRVVLVADGQAALDALRGSEHFDLAILDLQMPMLYGHEVILRYRQDLDRPRIPAFLLTADVTPEAMAAAASAGFERVLIKPITADELLEAIAGVFEKRRPARPAPAPAPLEPVNNPAAVRPVLRRETFEQLRRALPDEALVKTVCNFVKDTAESLQRFQHALDTEDGPCMKETVHFVKSSASAIGAERLSECCQHLLDAVARHDWAEVRRVVQRLPDEVAAAVDLLNTYYPC